MKKFSLLLLVMGFLLNISSAQIATISDEVYVRNEENVEIIGKVEGHFFVVKDVSEGAKLYSFDPYLKLDWENEIRCEKKNFKVLGTMARPDYFGVILQYRKKGEIFVQYQKLDETGAIIDSTIVKNYGRRTFSPRPLVVKSADKKSFAIFNDKEDNMLEATAFDTEKMERIWDHTVRTNNISLRNELYQLVLSNRGSLFTVLFRDYPKAHREKKKFSIITLAKGESDLQEIPFNSNFLFDVYFDYDNQNQNLVGAGLYNEKKAYRASGFFFIKMPAFQAENYQIQFQTFDENLLTTIRGKESEKGDTFNEAYINDLVLKSDGGLVLVIERYKKVSQAQVNSIPRNVPSRNISTAQAEYHYDDIILVNINEDGSSSWEEILYKRQFSRDDNGRLSSFFIMKAPNMLRFLYNDEIRNNNKISEYTLTRKGENERNSILDTDGYDVQIMFKDGIQTAKNEIIVPSIKRKSMKLVRIKYGT